MQKQSKGILSLATTEMWERFSFYTMQYSLVLYATATIAKGGLGMSDAKALQVVGFYTGLTYATPLLGGFVGDRWLGRRNCIHLGGIFMAIGHFILAFGSYAHFYLSMFFLAIGCGLFKPNITSLVGSLYVKEDERRESGYNIFYAGINVGALLSGLVGGLLNDNFGYYASFFAAGICMIVGILNFKFMTKNIRYVGAEPNHFPRPQIIVPFKNLSSFERNGVYLFLFLSFMNVIWQIAYAQWAGSLNLLAERNTNRMVLGHSVPTVWFESLNSFFIVLLSPAFAFLYAWLQKRNKKIDLSYKLALGYFWQSLACFIIIPALFEIQKNPHFQASPWFQFFFYLFSTVAELFTVPVMFSATSFLSPKGYEARLMGVYIFTSLSLGTVFAGYVASFFVATGSLNLFLSLGLITSFFGIVHLFLNSKINTHISQLKTKSCG